MIFLFFFFLINENRKVEPYSIIHPCSVNFNEWIQKMWISTSIIFHSYIHDKYIFFKTFHSLPHNIFCFPIFIQPFYFIPIFFFLRIKISVNTHIITKINQNRINITANNLKIILPFKRITIHYLHTRLSRFIHT